MMAEDETEKQLPSTGPSKRHTKLARLPSNAKVHKRPLLHPQLVSPYSGPQQPKIVYVSTNTPFLSAVKRTEKLLRLADRRAVQSATTLVTQNRGKRKRRGGDELLKIAETVETEKKRRKLDGKGTGAREEVLLKGTGKAIQKVLELALWFQQRDKYTVQLKTGSVGAVDDITMEETHGEADESGDKDNEAETDEMVRDTGQSGISGEKGNTRKPGHGKNGAGEPSLKDEIPETRIRYTSVLEVAVGLR